MALKRASKWSFWTTVVELLEDIKSLLGGGSSSSVLVKEETGTTGTTTVTATGTKIDMNNTGGNDLTFQPSSYLEAITCKAGEALTDVNFEEFESVEIISTDTWQILIHS